MRSSLLQDSDENCTSICWTKQLHAFSKPKNCLSSPSMFAGIRSVHFVGICGTAMAATAVALKEKGLPVTGSDQAVYPPMSTFLAERKIEVMDGYSERNLAHKPDLVVIGNAISRGNPEAEYCLDHKVRFCS